MSKQKKSGQTPGYQSIDMGCYMCDKPNPKREVAWIWLSAYGCHVECLPAFQVNNPEARLEKREWPTYGPDQVS